MHTGDAGTLDGAGFLFVQDRVKDTTDASVEDLVYDGENAQKDAPLHEPDTAGDELAHHALVLGGVGLRRKRG